MKWILLVMALLFLSGCAAEKTINDINGHIQGVTGVKEMTTECLAGFLSGMGNSTENVKILKAIEDMNKMVDITSKDYVNCRVYGLETSILLIKGKEAKEDALGLFGKIMGGL